jgi:hypothetical protein
MDWTWEITDRGHIEIFVKSHGHNLGTFTLRPGSILADLEEDLETAATRDAVEDLGEWRRLATSLLNLSTKINASLNEDGRA